MTKGLSHSRKHSPKYLPTCSCFSFLFPRKLSQKNPNFYGWSDLHSVVGLGIYTREKSILLFKFWIIMQNTFWLQKMTEFPWRYAQDTVQLIWFTHPLILVAEQVWFVWSCQKSISFAFKQSPMLIITFNAFLAKSDLRRFLSEPASIISTWKSCFLDLLNIFS